MRCDRCGATIASITSTESREGAAKKLTICEDCARELGFEISTVGPPTGIPSGVPAPGKIVGMLDVVAPEPLEGEVGPGPECPGCGTTLAQLRQQSVFGCPRCYETFAEKLEPLFRKIHGAVRHRGRLPGGRLRDPEESP